MTMTLKGNAHLGTNGKIPSTELPSGLTTIAQSTYAVTHNASVDTDDHRAYLAMAIGSKIQSMYLVGITGDTAVVFSNDFSKTTFFAAMPYRPSTMTIVDSNGALPGTAKQIYGKYVTILCKNGKTISNVEMYADLGSDASVTVQDDIGRTFVIMHHASPASDPYLRPMAVDSSRTSDSQFLGVGGSGTQYKTILLGDSGYIPMNSLNAGPTVFPVYFVSDTPNYLTYDSASSIGDLVTATGWLNSQGGPDIDDTSLLIPVYIDETETDEGHRLYHRVSFLPYDFDSTLGGAAQGRNVDMTTVYYDATGTKGVQLWVNLTTFPMSFEANFTSTSNSEFKSSSTIKSAYEIV